MTAPSVTNTFSNGTTADATAVNQNFSDLISAMTDGSKSFSIDALTVAGAATFNGAVSLGNATGDDITVTGYVASDILPKNDAQHDLGSASKQWCDLYTKGTTSLDGAVTINESGAAVDFRVEGDTIEHLLFCDGSADKVGIGTTSPGALLHVEAADGVADNNYVAILNNKEATAGRNNGLYIKGGSNTDDFNLRTVNYAEADLFVVKGDGKVGIGTTSPTNTLHVVSNTDTGNAANFTNSGNNANRYGVAIQAGANDGSGTTYYVYCLDGDGTPVGYIANTSGTFAITDASDRRLKTNIINWDADALNIVKNVPVVSFNRIKNPDDKPIVGFIAQDVEQVFEQAVTKDRDDYLGLDKASLVAVLWKAIQEQQAQIDELKRKIA
jgi:hypothetical protein